MKGKMLYPQGKCKSIISETVILQMKNALKVIEYPDAIIGPKTVSELIELNTDKTGYIHCIFDELLKEKITTDYNTIKDGLELLKFYKERNKYFTAFDKEIIDLDNLISEQNRTKFATSEIVIDTENLVTHDISKFKDKKNWVVYFNGEIKGGVDTLSKQILFAKCSMFYSSYNEVVIKFKK